MLSIDALPEKHLGQTFQLCLEQFLTGLTALDNGKIPRIKSGKGMRRTTGAIAASSFVKISSEKGCPFG